MMTFPIYGKIKNVPNHQPDKVVITYFSYKCKWNAYPKFMVLSARKVIHGPNGSSLGNDDEAHLCDSEGKITSLQETKRTS